MTRLISRVQDVVANRPAAPPGWPAASVPTRLPGGTPAPPGPYPAGPAARYRLYPAMRLIQGVQVLTSVQTPGESGGVRSQPSP
ncbi:hypothetical protein SSCG_03573 [Streptomyces clavuligerus]|nr:hypothetical protein SSCG_03573 [Streptomyces clavuligerus]